MGPEGVQGAIGKPPPVPAGTDPCPYKLRRK